MSLDREIARLLPRLRRFAHALSNNAADADDLTQMTVERALTTKSVCEAGARIDSWLYRIARNLWIDTIRRRNRRSRLHERSAEGIAEAGDSEAEMAAMLDLKLIMQKMSALPLEQREVIALVLIEGRSYKECADVLDLPMGTVASRLTRGRTQLLQLLDAAPEAGCGRIG